jgi:2-aminobenzoate-CoA ligase
LAALRAAWVAAIQANGMRGMTSYQMRSVSGHVDTFARDKLPPVEEWPELRFMLPELQYAPRINVARVLVDDAIAEGHGAKPALYHGTTVWTYDELLEHSCRIAHVLVQDQGLVAGNRVLLMAPNSRQLAAAWLAVVRAGGIAVTVTPLLRAKELGQIASKAHIDLALCDAQTLSEVHGAASATGRLSRVLTWGNGDLETRMGRQPSYFAPVDTAADDVALLAFTSGTTGTPKATMHFHRDVLAMADVVGRHLLKTAPTDVYVGSPPLGFTFGLGALLVFPLRFRGAAAYVEQPTVDGLLEAAERFRATALFTAPTMYRRLIAATRQFNLKRLRHCVSAGEPLSMATSDAWYEATGIRLIDGIGSTEMIHIFIGASGADVRPGATGKPLPGYEAVVLDGDGQPHNLGTGRLAVRGPTGCRYLDDPRQHDYVMNGWNVTGDVYRIDDEGYFWFEARGDDMIVSSGHNIAAPEVEGALLEHPSVRECAVVASPDARRGQIVKAFVVLRAGAFAGQPLVNELQQFVKQRIAPYKYPRAIEFIEALPKTPNGKLQRSALRAAEMDKAVQSG